MRETSPRSPSPVAAALLALAGFTLWVAGDLCLKTATRTGAPVYELLPLCGIGGLAGATAIAMLRGGLKKLRPRHPRELACLALATLALASCWMVALQHLPLASCYTVAFLTPMTVAIVAAWLLKEPLAPRTALAIAAGFAGVIVAINPERLAETPSGWLGYIAAFGGMLAMSGQQVLLRVLGKKENPESTIFYPRLALIAGGLAVCALYGVTPLAPVAWAGGLASGGIGVIGWLCLAEAYKRAHAAHIAPFQYSQIVSGGLAGYLLWDETLSWHLAAGSAIIIGAGFYIAAHARKVRNNGIVMRE